MTDKDIRKMLCIKKKKTPPVPRFIETLEENESEWKIKDDESNLTVDSEEE
jgi:hypothetical protein